MSSPRAGATIEGDAALPRERKVHGMAWHRWLALVGVAVVSTTVTAITTGTEAIGAAPDEVTDSQEWLDLVAFVDGIDCPDLTAYGLVLDGQSFELPEEVVDGTRVPRAEGATNECSYTSAGAEAADGDTVSIRVDVVYLEFQAWGCDGEREENRDNPRSQRVTLAQVVEGRTVTAEYWIGQGVIDVSPGVEAALESATAGLAREFAQRTAFCQYPVPAQLTCPELDDWTMTEPDEPRGLALQELRCWYNTSGLTDQLWAEDEVNRDAIDQLTASLEIAVLWATDRTPAAALPRACEDFGKSPRPKYAVFGGDGTSSQAEWLYYGSLDSPMYDSALFDEHAQAVRAQVAEQTITCSPEMVTSPWTPLPAYLADVFAPGRYDAPPLPPALDDGWNVDLTVAVGATPDAPVAPITQVTDPLAPSATDTPGTEPTTAPAAPAATPTTASTTTEPVPTAAEVPASGSGLLGGALGKIVTIGALVLSLLALALAFVMVRKEARVRPAMDIARVVIVLVVAAVMFVVFSRGAPWWAIATAVAAGGALGWFQGRHLVVRMVAGRPMAARGAIAIVLFGTGLVLTQVAGLLNRTGVIALGIAVSFLSAATTAGLIAGRRPQLIEARRAAAVAAIAVIVGGLASFAPASDQPATAHPATAQEPTAQEVTEQYLVDLVDWSTTELNGGLLADEGKPPIAVAIPPALESVPDPISRDVDWVFSRKDDGSDPYTYSVSETFEFAPDDEGECCSVHYDSIGTRTSASGIETDYVMGGRLDDVVGASELDSISGHTAGVPFGEMNRDSFGSADGCQRVVGESRGYNSVAAIDTFTIGGEAREPERRWTEAEFTIGCEVDGFTAEAALERAPELAPRDDRASPCPANSEIYPALASDELEYESLRTVGMLFTEPHEAACIGFGEIGSPLPGSTRSEFSFEFAAPADQDNADETTMQLLTRPTDITAEYQCEIDETGRATDIAEDESCRSSTWHRLDDLGSWVSIYTDNNYDDGPNVEVVASLPWGSYQYRCHHCEPSSPEITRWIGALHDYVNGWTDTLPDGTITDGTSATDVTSATDGSATGATGATDDTSVASDTDDTPDTDGEGSSLADDTSTDDIAAAALVALIGLIGSGGILATAIAESGHSLGQLATTIRNEGYAGLNGLLDLPPDSLVDEYGEVIVPDEQGMYQYGDQTGTREEVEEWVAEGQEAIIDRQDEVAAFVAEMNSDEAAQQRFDDLAANSAELRSEILEEMRVEQASIDRLGTILEQRDAALAQLELAWADQEYEGTRSSWDQITLEALQGMRDEIAALPGEVVDGTRTVVTTLADAATALGDPVNWQIIGETIAETAYDLAGIAAGNSFGDGLESIGDGVKFGGNIAGALANQLVEDPLGTIAMFTGLADLADSLDPDSTLGSRLGSLALGLVDLAGNLAGLGIAGSADDLLDISRAADAADAAADTTRGVVRAADAAEDATGAVRTGQLLDTTGDAGLGIARTPDALLSPDLLRTRDEIVIAIRNGDDDAIRALFQGDGMKNMAALESAGGLTDEMAEAIVRNHDEITGTAIRTGTTRAIDDFGDVAGIKPTQILVGNSGSMGPGRSVLTDADSTIVAVFDRNELEAWRHNNQIFDGDTFRTPTRLEAQEVLQQQFADLHQIKVQEALNPTGSTVNLTVKDMDISNYSGFGPVSGPADAYPSGFTTSRQSVQGSTDVYRIDPVTGDVHSYTTGGDAIIDQNEINRLELGRDDFWDQRTLEGMAERMSDDELTDLAKYLENRFHNPTEIPYAEMQPLLEQQVRAAAHYDDVKSISKAVDRVQYIAGRTGRSLPDADLVKAAVAIRNQPTATAEIIAGLHMTEQEFTTACRDMVLTYGGAS